MTTNMIANMSKERKSTSHGHISPYLQKRWCEITDLRPDEPASTEVRKYRKLKTELVISLSEITTSRT